MIEWLFDLNLRNVPVQIICQRRYTILLVGFFLVVTVCSCISFLTHVECTPLGWFDVVMLSYCINESLIFHKKEKENEERNQTRFGLLTCLGKCYLFFLFEKVFWCYVKIKTVLNIFLEKIASLILGVGQNSKSSFEHVFHPLS